MRVLFEDEDLLAIDKPAGLNTHRPDPQAPAGLYEYLTHPNRGRPDWRNLAIVHRLDKETSGVLVFAKSRRACRSLGEQFRTQRPRKTYLFWTDRRPSRQRVHARSPQAETDFELIAQEPGRYLIRAVPLTGKTHQIRRHAAENGFPILGDTEYGGGPAPRLLLHAYRLELSHPRTGEPLILTASVPDALVESEPLVAARELRESVFAGEETDAYRLVNGAGDGMPAVVVDWFAGVALVQWQRELPEPARREWRQRLQANCRPVAVAEQLCSRRRRTPPEWVATAAGGPPPEEVVITENGLRFLIRFDRGCSPGLFLDQRENRLWIQRQDWRGWTVLNCFAYTCGFSVAAARAGARVTSVDLSRNHLERGCANFRLNGLDPAAHEFVAADVMSWLAQAARRGRRFDAVLLDPPTFATTRRGDSFRARRDYLELEIAAQSVLAPSGVLFCSTNQRSFGAADFIGTVREATRRANRVIAELEFVTQPFDFRVAPGEQPYLKTLWARLEAGTPGRRVPVFPTRPDS